MMRRELSWIVAALLLTGCKSASSELNQLAAWSALVSHEEKVGECRRVFEARVRESMQRVELGDDQETIVEGVLRALPRPESDALGRAAEKFKGIPENQPGSMVLAPVMSALREEFVETGICEASTPEITADVFADVLTVYWVRRGANMEQLFPLNDYRQGGSTTAEQLMLSLVLSSREK